MANVQDAGGVGKYPKEYWDSNGSQHWRVKDWYPRGGISKSGYASHTYKNYKCTVCGRQTTKPTGNSSSSGSGGGSGGGGGGGSGGGSSSPPAKTYEGTDDFPVPAQPFYIYDKDNKDELGFDGVIKISHSMSLKVEEEPDAEKASAYVNNARNEPNKVTLDVIMSDVYTTRNALTNKDEVRSRSALTVLNDLKKSRRLVDVVTNLMTYTDMLLSGISLTQDDGTTHFGWFGQLTFQEKPVSEGGGGGGSKTTPGVHPSSQSGRTPSLWVNLIGGH